MPIRLQAEEIKYQLRVEAGMTLAEFAKSIGRDPSTVSMVINGRRTSAPIMKKNSETLDAARKSGTATNIHLAKKKEAAA